MAKKSTEKKTSLEPSEVFCAVGLLMPTKDMRDLVKDQTGSELLTWAATDGYAIANKGIDPLDDRFKKMFKECAKLNRESTDLKKRTEMVANIVAGFSGAIGSKVFMKAMNTFVSTADKVYLTGAQWPEAVNKFRMKDEDANLNLISSLKKRYGVNVGYSGHESGLAISYAAAALGASSIERHITLDRAMYGSDQAASLEPSGLRQLVGAIRKIESAMGDGQKKILPVEEPIAKKLREHLI